MVKYINMEPQKKFLEPLALSAAVFLIMGQKRISKAISRNLRWLLLDA